MPSPMPIALPNISSTLALTPTPQLPLPCCPIACRPLPLVVLPRLEHRLYPLAPTIPTPIAPVPRRALIVVALSGRV
jgi:hypothetical protein